MATYLGTNAIFQVMSGATAGNFGGGGFNPKNANFPTDGVIAGGTGNAATITPTSSYSPVSADFATGVMVFFPVQTGVTYPSWFPVTASGSGVITMNTAIGAGLQLINNRIVPNVSAGCASTATPTLTYGIDYSRMTSARYTATTGTTVVSGTTFADGVTNTVGKNWIGNFICDKTSTGGTAGWYEIVSETAGTATLDRSAGAGTSVTYYLGGAVSLGGSTTGITDVIFFALGAGATTSGCRTFIQGNATYTPSATITTLAGNTTWSSMFEGYKSVNGDRPSIASGNQPILSMGINVFNIAANSQVWNLTFNGTAVEVVNQNGNGAALFNSKCTNKSTSANNAAIKQSVAQGIIGSCEAICYNGYAIQNGIGVGFIFGNYCHDSQYGITVTGGLGTIVNNIISGCITAGIQDNGGNNFIFGNTVYGAENKLGSGILSPYNSTIIFNNILYGVVNGYGGSDTELGGIADYNCFYNNTNNIAAATTGAYFGAHDITTTNPSFTSVAQVTGTTATSSTTTLTDSSKNFTTAGVVAGRDYLNVTASTGGTVAQYGITAVGTTTLTTDNSLGTGTAVSYQITTGRNFSVGINLKATGSIGSFPAGLTTGYLDIGAVQRQETAAGGAYTFGF